MQLRLIAFGCLNDVCTSGARDSQFQAENAIKIGRYPDNLLFSLFHSAVLHSFTFNTFFIRITYLKSWFNVSFSEFVSCSYRMLHIFSGISGGVSPPVEYL